MERYGEFGSMFEMSNQVRESQEFHLNETDSEWLKKEIQAFMKKYGVDDWDEAVSMYATHNVLPEDKVRVALGESINEQDEDEERSPEEDHSMKDLETEEEEPLGPEDEEIGPEEDFLEDEVDIPVPEDKEYVGKSEDTHFYMVPEKNDQGEIIDMKIVDQEENQLFSAEENGIEPTDMSLFLNTVFRDSDVGISEIDRQVIVKYVIPAAEQEMVNDMEDEEEELGGEELSAGDGGTEEEFAEEDLGAPEEEGDFEEEEIEDEGEEEMTSPKKKKKDLMRPMESKLTEKKIEFDGHTFDVQLVDEGAEATVISVNGREFRFDSGFAELFHEEGVLTEAGVEELAKDALANLGQEEFEALAESVEGSKRGLKEGVELEDPTREEMLAALKPLMDQGEDSEFDAEAAMYWYASDYHGGQNSNLYSVLSTSEFSPGASHSSVEDEGEMAEMMYRELESQFGGDESNAEDESDENAEDEPDEDEPDEEDIFLSPAGHLGGKTQVSAGGKVIGTFDDETDARLAALQWMQDNQFWPAVWVVSDHGNYHQISLGREDTEEAVDMKTNKSNVEEQSEGEFKHVYLVKYLKDDGEGAEMRVEALDDNDAKMMLLKRKGVDKVTDVKKIAESEEVDEAMSRKYYIKFAEMLKNMRDRDAARNMAKQMAEMFRADNPRFDRFRFYDAAGFSSEGTEESVTDEKCGKKHMEEEVEESEEVEETDVEECDKKDELVSDAAKATEEFDEDELEAHAAKMRKNEGKDEPGKRDGTGPYKGSKGRRKMAGEECPMEEEVEESEESVDEEKDPKAKVRNRGNAVFQSASSKVKDDKDHFPINSENQARNALARANQYSSTPAWYKGSLESLKKAVASAVKKAYPSIEVTKKAVESVEEVEEPVVESVDPACSLAVELLGLNESVDSIEEIQEGTEVTILSNKDMRVIYECVKVSKVTEHAVEVTGNEAEVDQEWYRFDMCQIYPV